MILIYFLFSGLVIYVCAAAVIAGGLHTRYRRRPDHPTVSIVIPARNEEETLPQLLESLLSVDYPPDRLEVLVINDQSSDQTRLVAEGFRSRFRCRYEIFDVEPENDSNLRAKTLPLAQGIERARGEFVLMPDADNRIPKDWVQCMTSYFADGVGMVCGTTLPDSHRQSNGLLTAFETLDAALLLGTCAGFSGLRNTQALIGSNFAVRRQVYQQIGTYRSLDYHEIEDLSLLHALQATGEWKAVFPADANTLLLTRPHRSLLDLIQQRRRWMGGRQYVKPALRAALTFAIIAHVVWPFLVLAPFSWLLGTYAMLVLGDAAVAAPMLYRYRRTPLIPLLIFYPIFVAAYAVPLLIMKAAGREVKWKERAY